MQYPSRNVFFEGGAKNPLKAHRWSPWCWLPTPSWGLVLGVKKVGRAARACRRWPCLRGDLSLWSSYLFWVVSLWLGVWTCMW